MKRFMAWLTLLCLISASALATDPFLTASKLSDYRPALNDLSIAINNQGYTLVKIQPIDQGLRRKGYEALDYKVVFFANRDQVDKVLTASPEASVVLPLMIILYRNGDSIVASAPSLDRWKGVFNKTLDPMIDRWQRDIAEILREYERQPLVTEYRVASCDWKKGQSHPPVPQYSAASVSVPDPIQAGYATGSCTTSAGTDSAEWQR